MWLEEETGVEERERKQRPEFESRGQKVGGGREGKRM